MTEIPPEILNWLKFGTSALSGMVIVQIVGMFVTYLTQKEQASVFMKFNQSLKDLLNVQTDTLTKMNERDIITSEKVKSNHEYLKKNALQVQDIGNVCGAFHKRLDKIKTG